jgi:D-3-phosphoglycerate dehydrogenase
LNPRIYLSFAPAARALYFGDKAVAGLRAHGDLRLNDAADMPTEAGLIDALRGIQVVISDRRIAGSATLFAACPDLLVFQRCAIDIRNIDVAAASAAGVLVTRASAGFGNSVAEWVLGAMFDLSRGISRSVVASRSGGRPTIDMGRELRGSTIGIIG